MLAPLLAQGVVRNHYFQVLDSRQGLAQSTVTAMLQDQAGFVWIGTQADLQRFDGHAFQGVAELVQDQAHLPSFPVAMAEDDAGRLYISTLQDGLYLLDPADRALRPAPVGEQRTFTPEGRVDALAFQPGVGLWYASRERIGRYTVEDGQYLEVLRFDQSTRAPPGTPAVHALALDGNDGLWAAANHGVYRIDTRSGTTTRQSVGAARAIRVDAQGRVWIGGRSGLAVVTDGHDRAQHVWPNERAPPASACCEIRALDIDADGQLWFSVEGDGLWRLDPDTGASVKLPAHPGVDGMLTETEILHLMVDRSNLLWTGGRLRGVATTPARASGFQTLFDNRPGQNLVRANYVHAVTEDDGQLWIGTSVGLRRFNLAQERFEDPAVAPVIPGAGDPAFTQNIFALEPAGDGRLWLGTMSGPRRFDPASGRVDAVYTHGEEEKHVTRMLLRASDGRLWLGRGHRGLAWIDPEDPHTAHPVPPQHGVDGTHQQTLVLAALEDRSGRLWFGGLSGLSMRDPGTGQFSHFQHDPERPDSLSGNIIRAIYQDRDDRLWVGSHGGLDEILTAADGSLSFRSASMDSAQRVTYGVVEDEQGYLWLSGNAGLARLDKSTGTAVRYGLEAGLQDLEYNGGAVAKLSDGRLAFGGIRGLNLVSPQAIRTSRFEPPVVLTRVTRGRQPDVLGWTTRPELIRMRQQDRILALDLATLDYTAPGANLVSWKLEGLDKAFSEPAPVRQITLTNLRAGRYRLRVRGSNHAGVWNPAELQVAIRILPPWWRAPWAMLLWGLLALALAALVWESRRRRAAMRADFIAQIREREERLKLSLWGAGDVFWDWNVRENRIHRIGGGRQTRPEALGEYDIEVWRRDSVHPDDWPDVRRAMRDYLAGRTDIFVSEHRRRDGRGGWVWVQARGKVVERDADHNPLRVAGTAQDITEMRRAERERRIASEVLRSMGEAVAVLDLDFRFVSVNPAFSRITGYREADVLGGTDELLQSSQQPANFHRNVRTSLAANGHWRGESWLRRNDGAEFLAWMEASEVRDDLGQRSHYVIVITDITDRKRSEQELRYLANYDTLTGLPNRSFLSERLARAVVRARRNDSRIAILFLDLDHFKLINDSLGHAIGDRVLKAVAGRLSGLVRRRDAVARLGGDEFTIIMEELDSPDAALDMAQTVIAAFREPIAIPGRGDMVLSPSIGIALYPDHAQIPTDLLKHADAAMYRAKDRGRNTWQFYDESIDLEIRERALLASALRRALERDELSLVFQPRQALFDGRITGVEALLRWHSPEFGLIQPSTFIPIAEEIGVILQIGDWVLEQACRQAVAWQATGLGKLAVAVNVSVLQLLRGNLPDSVARVLETSGLPPECLELELTESVIMANAEPAITLLRDLKALGVSIAVDDFGTGYSSLVYLKRLPIDILKIDREFVGDISHDPDDEAITSAIISMAHSLGLTVVAEGVETQEQLLHLRERGCDEIQGFLLAEPMPATACLTFLQTHGDEQLILPLG